MFKSLVIHASRVPPFLKRFRLSPGRPTSGPLALSPEVTLTQVEDVQGFPIPLSNKKWVTLPFSHFLKLAPSRC